AWRGRAGARSSESSSLVESSSALQGGGVRGGGWLSRHAVASKHRESPTSPYLSAPKGGEEHNFAAKGPLKRMSLTRRALRPRRRGVWRCLGRSWSRSSSPDRPRA